jgi:hypothetical protein
VSTERRNSLSGIFEQTVPRIARPTALTIMLAQPEVIDMSVQHSCMAT